MFGLSSLEIKLKGKGMAYVGVTAFNETERWLR